MLLVPYMWASMMFLPHILTEASFFFFLYKLQMI